MRTVLFLCTGNYYRSRFAEEIFNFEARRGALGWLAKSRELALERGKDNVGPVSLLVLDALERRGVIANDADRFPQRCLEEDMGAAHRIVALKESEHRPLMLKRFPAWENRAEYWDIDDIGGLSPTVALGRIECEIKAMIAGLSADPK